MIQSNSKITIVNSKNGNELYTNVDAFIRDEKGGEEGSRIVEITYEDITPEEGDVVKVLNKGPYFGEWEIWKEPKFNLGPIGSFVKLPVMKPERLVAKRKASTNSPAGGVQVHITGNVTGSNINISSNLDRVNQRIEMLPEINQDSKKELLELISQFKEELQKASAEYPKETDKLSRRLADAVADVSEPPIDKEEADVSVGRFTTALQNVSSFLPTLFDTGMRIANELHKFF